MNVRTHTKVLTADPNVNVPKRTWIHVYLKSLFEFSVGQQTTIVNGRVAGTLMNFLLRGILGNRIYRESSHPRLRRS
jgi:hypothetical protein